MKNIYYSKKHDFDNYEHYFFLIKNITLSFLNLILEKIN